MNPTTTTISGEAGDWDDEIWNVWNENVVPKFEEGQSCLSANFFRPRRYQDEFSPGTTELGFTYVVMPGYKVTQWKKRVLEKPLGTP